VSLCERDFLHYPFPRKDRQRENERETEGERGRGEGERAMHAFSGIKSVTGRKLPKLFEISRNHFRPFYVRKNLKYCARIRTVYRSATIDRSHP